MPNKEQRPWRGGARTVEGDTLCPDSTAVGPPPQGPEPAGPVPSCCLDKRGLARYLGLSVRSVDRANALGLLPAPDLVVRRSPRWSPETISRWLRTRPRLPGRGRRAAE
jgi:hypothetical protein